MTLQLWRENYNGQEGQAREMNVEAGSITAKAFTVSKSACIALACNHLAGCGQSTLGMCRNNRRGCFVCKDVIYDSCQHHLPQFGLRKTL